MRQIPYGEINFETIRNENNLYVDKTKFIEKLESSPNLRRAFYLRPGRFGKSLFVSMLNYYYAIEEKEKFEKLFGDLYIGKNQTENRNKYYILKFDFSGMDISSSTTIEQMEDIFNRKVRAGINEFANRYKLEIKTEDTITPAETIGNAFVEFKAKKPNEKIYVLIDEYDNFTNGILKGDAQRFLDTVSIEGFVKGFYATIKEEVGTGLVERFFATGIAPVTLDSMTTGFNIATDITKDSDFVDMVGLTNDEVKALINEILPEKTENEQEEIYNEMKTYYDGYRFSEESETKTFNTTLAMYYLNYYQNKGKKPLKMMDVNIAANFEKLDNLITLKNNPYSKEVLEALIQNNEIIDDITSKFNLSMELTRKDILSILFYFGYCTIAENKVGLKVLFKIPNYVMSEIYNEYFIYLLKKEGMKINTEKIDEAMYEIALEGKIEKLCKIVEEYLSYIGNISWQKYDEKYIKGYIHAILQLSEMYRVYLEYNVKNNGYIDVVAFKVPESGAKYQIMLEVKYIKKEEAKTKEQKEKIIEEKRKSAIEQIQKYAEDERLSKEEMKKYVLIFVGEKLEVIEEVE